MKILPLALCLTTLCSCSTYKSLLKVDASQHCMAVYKDYTCIAKIPVEISSVGLGDVIHSNKTPLGDFQLKKEPDHRFGPVLRLWGEPGSNERYQGNDRGILIHQDLTRGDGTHGCVAVPDLNTMKWLFAWVENDTHLVIQR